MFRRCVALLAEGPEREGHRPRLRAARGAGAAGRDRRRGFPALRVRRQLRAKRRTSSSYRRWTNFCIVYEVFNQLFEITDRWFPPRRAPCFQKRRKKTDRCILEISGGHLKQVERLTNMRLSLTVSFHHVEIRKVDTENWWYLNINGIVDAFCWRSMFNL